MLIKEEWTSRQSGTADAAGVYAFRGFFGRYDVRMCAAQPWNLDKDARLR